MKLLIPLAFVLSGTTVALADVTLIATTTIPADSHDKSGLTDLIGGTIPHDRLGGFGSAIEWTGKGNEYIVQPDRGPRNGEVNYLCRFHHVTITVPSELYGHTKGMTPGAATFEVTKTVMLTDENGVAFNGASGGYNPRGPIDGSKDHRLDPEGIRLGKDGTLYLSDEYGPHVLAFDLSGKLKRRFEVPLAFFVANRSGLEAEELPPGNSKGRQANKGFESLAILPDGKTLVAMIQDPLIQDHGLDASNEKLGVNLRAVWFSIETGKALKQAVYPMTNAGHGTNELLALTNETFLAIERDGKGGDKAKTKTIMKVKFAGASDVSKVEALPATGMPDGMVAAKTSVFIDMLDPAYGQAGPKFPAKVEGLTFGPDLPDGRRMLVVTSDNDFKDDEPSYVWVFAIDKADLK